MVYTFLGSAAYSETRGQLPFSKEYVAHIESLFFDGEKLSTEKLDEYMSEVNERRSQHLLHLINYYRYDKGHSIERAREKANEKKSIESYNILLELAEELKDSSSKKTQLEIADKILNLSDSIKTEGPDFGAFLAFFNKLKISNDGAPASNLVNINGEYVSEKDLKKYKDLSRLNPPSDGSFWTDTKIESYKIAKTYNPSSPMFKGVDVRFPQGSVKFEEVRKTQTTPKLTVSAYVNGDKREYKLKIGNEIHSEPTSAALFAALGFNTDPSKYVQNIKMYLGKSTEAEIRKEFASYYRNNNFDGFIKEIGTDTNGKYFIFKEGLLEAKPSENLRVGPWSWGLKGKSDQREVRALNILNVWVGNKDVKEAINNKLVIKKEFNGKLYYVNHDIGWGYGKNYVEGADTFSWDSVRRYNGSSVDINMYLLYNNSAFKDVTTDDAKWMVRRIARLSKKQIRDAINLGGWPEGPAILLTEKMSNRRNQLVKALGLSSEFGMLDVNKRVTSESGSVVDGKIDNDRLKDLAVPVTGEWQRSFEAALLMLHESLVEGTISLSTNAIQNISFDFPDLVSNGKFAGNLMVGLKRTIAQNREPKDANDRYIVKDTVRLGFKLGASAPHGIKGELRLYRDYTLYYGIPESKVAYRKLDYITALLNPLKPGTGKLPDRYTLLVEDYLEGKGSIEVSSGRTIEIRPELSISKVILNRLLVSDKGTDTVKVMVDDSVYTELALKLKLALSFVKFQFFEASLKSGRIERNFWEIRASENTRNNRFHEALAAVRSKADISSLENIVTHSRTIAKFKSSKRDFNFLNMIFDKTTKTRNDIEEWSYGNNPWSQKRLQLEIKDESGWNGLYEGELRSGNAFFVGTRDGNGNFIDPVLGLNIFIEDRGASSKELASILKMINTATNDYTFMPIKPELHSRDHFWGTVWAYLDILIYESGIKKLLSISSNELYSSFYEVTGMYENQWNHAVKDRRPEARVFEDFNKTVSLITKAQSKDTSDDQIKYLVKALNKAFINTSGSIKSQVLAAIDNVLDEDDKFVGSRVTQPHYEEVIMPDGKPMVNQKGKLKHIDARLKDFDLTETNKVYNLFDSTYVKDDLAPSKRKIDISFK